MLTRRDYSFMWLKGIRTNCLLRTFFVVGVLCFVRLLLDMDLTFEHHIAEESNFEHHIADEHRIAEESINTIALPMLSGEESINTIALPMLSGYDCVKWRQTTGCSPDGSLVESDNDSCSTKITSEMSGYCEIKHRETGDILHVLPVYCNSIKPEVYFTCDMFKQILEYSATSVKYLHDPQPEDFSESKSLRSISKHGIVFVVHERVLLSIYASIRSLRTKGTLLPIEIWFKRNEIDREHVLLHNLVDHYGVQLREINDDRATGYMTKLYAIFYSSFENVLLLDADNFAVQDPTYLFYSNEFLEHGAVFWPDYWRSGNWMTNFDDHSFVWTVFGVNPVEMFEQESGQVLINRLLHRRALNLLMYYGFSTPRLWEEMRLVWGDKDLFRLAWLKTHSSFHMIKKPPASIGLAQVDKRLFCGLTMAQYDPANDIIFLHRNSIKLSSTTLDIQWRYVQEFKVGAKLEDYIINYVHFAGDSGFDRYVDCFARYHEDRNFDVGPIERYSFANLETQLFQYVREGMSLLEQRK